MAESFGRLLKRHRLAAGLSQEALAERAGVSIDAISYLERDARHAPHKATLDLLVAALLLDEAARRQIEEAARLARARGPRAERQALLRNLPRIVTPLIGRAGDVAAVLNLLELYSLVTITGSGGVGKTRVAVEVAGRYAELKSCGVAFVDLSPVADGSLIVDTVVAAVSAPRPTESSRADALSGYLRNGTWLLILDNCEHILDDVAALAGEILQTCPSVTLLTTTRERLNIGGEALFRLPSLTFPDGERAAAKTARSYSALELFIERAKAVDSQFALTDENASLVADVCRRLEGIPLAIELAAARLPVFGLSTLQTRVSERFILAGAGRGVPGRQATMQATIAWSYGLLDPVQRALLNRLAVFAGGFTLEAAELVCPDEHLHVSEVADLLASLVDKSLVNASFDRKPARYTLLESVRAYALDQLVKTNSLDAVFRRHALWIAETSDKVREGGTYEPFLAELPNVRAALKWALSSEDEQDTVAAGRIAGGFRRLWIGTARHAEYRFWSEAIIERIDPQIYPNVTAHLFAGLAQATDGPSKLFAIERAIPLFERIGEYTGLAHLHAMLSTCFKNQGRFKEAENAAAQAVRISEMHSLEGTEGHVHGLGVLAEVAMEKRATNEARVHVMRALRIVPPQLHRWRTWLIEELGLIEFCEGRTEKALELTEEALRHTSEEYKNSRNIIRTRLSIYHLVLNHLDPAATLAREVLEEGECDSLFAQFYGIRSLAAIAALRGEAETGARALGFFDEPSRHIETDGGLISRAGHDLLVRAVRDRLPEPAIDRLRAEGRQMTFDQIVDELIGVTQTPASIDNVR